MKIIQLTEEHKSKLLEMCKTLFPEHENIFLCDDDYFLSNNIKISENTSKQTISIHWFEFCMTYLQFKFKKLGIELDLWLLTLPTTHLQWGNYNFNHPVDYLYEEFKKLK